MAWDGSGTFSRTNGTQTGSTTWANARDSGNNITASQHDTHDQDIADGINACLTKNGENSPTATFKPDNDDQRDLGSTVHRWRRQYISGYIVTPELRDAASGTEVTHKDSSGNNVGWMGMGYVAGLTYGNGNGAGGGDLTNDITIAAGAARDATNSKNMVLAAAITKQLDAAWSVGSAAGGLDAGAIGNSPYFIWLIARSDTGVVDVLFSLSATAPTMPANYDYKRLIGWFKRLAGSILAFTTLENNGGGLKYTWSAAALDVDSGSLTTAQLLSSLSFVPSGLKVEGDFRYHTSDAGGTSIIIQSPDEADLAPSTTGTPGLDISVAAGAVLSGRIRIWTNASAQIAARASAAVDVYRIFTVGWSWPRR